MWNVSPILGMMLHVCLSIYLAFCVLILLGQLIPKKTSPSNALHFQSQNAPWGQPDLL